MSFEVELLTFRGYDVAPDGRALKEKEKDAEEANDDLFWGLSCDLGIPMANLRQVLALGTPHGRRAKPENDGRRDQGVVFGIKLGRYVGRVAEHWEHHGPFCGEPLDQERRQEHAGEDERTIQGGQGIGA